MFTSETTADHYFFLKDSKSLKKFDIGLMEVVAKKCLNGTSKNSQTHGYTDKNTDGHFDLYKAFAQRVDA